MSTYEELHGKRVEVFDSDPTLDSAYEGQVWYNSTSGTLKSLLATGAWSSATALPETNSNAGGAGIQTAALFFGGRSGGAQKTQTLEYNGSGYSAGGAMGTARSQMGTGGTQTAALAATGVVEGPSSCPTQSEEYNGTSWTAGGSVSTARFASGGAGTQTSAVIAGGRLGPGTWSAVTEEYGGTSWTSGGALNQTKTLNGAMTGSLTAAVAFGGDGNPPTAAVNDLTFYDGTSWTETGNLPAANRNAGSAGPQTSAIMFGGMAPSETANAFRFDGTTFSATGSMGAATYIMAPAANASNNNTALSMGGYGGSAYLSRTEEYNFTTNTVTAAAAWSSGGSLNTGRINVSMGGTQTAAIVLGGHTQAGGEPKGVETYNGSAFTAGTAIGPYPGDYAAYAGPSTSGIIFGGAPYTTNTAEYDGEWSAGGSLSTGRSQLMAAGTGETSAVAIGGFTNGSTSTTATEEYGGTSWTGGGAMSTQRGRAAGFGIETAALVVGGNTSPDTTLTAASEEYGGSSWTAGGNLITATGTYIGGWGTQTDGVVVGGANPSYVTTTLGYDGTAWATRPNAANPAGRTQTAGADGSAGLRAGGGPNATQRDGSEEFNGETRATTAKTLTTS